MFERRIKKNYLFLDQSENRLGLSNFIIGSILCSIGLGKHIAFIDFDGNSKKFINFLENMSLNYSFRDFFKGTFLSLFTLNNNRGKLVFSETILPSVEYLNITEEMFWSKLHNYDLIFFSGFNSSYISDSKLVGFMRNCSSRINVILVTKDQDFFNEIKTEFLYKKRILLKKNKNLISKDNLNLVLGDNNALIYSYGLILAEFIYKSSVKIVYFNKSEDFFGDLRFFKFLKKWQSNNSIYGSFDFAVTGTKSLTRGSVLMEAKNGLMLLETAIRKKSSILADDILSILDLDSAFLNEFMRITENVNNLLVLSFSGYSSLVRLNKQILNRSGRIIEISDDTNLE